MLVFRGVFCRHMSWRTSTEIGLSELAANSVLSIGGAGGLALGAWILRRGGLPAARSSRRRTVAFFLLTSLANVTFLGLGGVALATGLFSGSPGLLLGLIPAVAGGRWRSRSRSVRAGWPGRSRGARCARGSPPARAPSARAWTRRCGCCGRATWRSWAGAAGYMLFDVAMLGVCFAAFGNDVPPVGVLLVA